MKRRHILLAVLAIALVLCMGIGTAFAYFTASSTAGGGLAINAKPTTTVTEKYGSQTKHVVISNAADGEPVYVRVKIFSPLPVTVGGTNWPDTADADGWYVYGGIVAPGGKTEELTATIEFPAPEDREEGDNYNVVVVYESTPVQYDGGGKALDPDWTLTLRTGTTEGGN